MKRLYEKPLFELHELIKNGSITTEELINQILERINKVEDKIHAYINVFDDESKNKAIEIDKKINLGESISVLLGVPLAVKDNICYKDHLTTCGSKMLYNYTPPFNASVLDQLIKEDVVVIGKTNMDEFAMGSSTEHSFFGPTKNPYNINKVPGGSSGGSAAAIAAGEAIIALGSDTGGNYAFH